MALELAYTGSGVIPVNTVLIGPIDADEFRSMSLQCISMGTSGAVSVQQSNDGVNWVTTLLHRVNAYSQNTIGSADIAWFNLIGRYVKVILSTATTAGPTSINVRLLDEKMPDTPNSILLSAGASTIGLVMNTLSGSMSSGPVFLYHKLPACAATTNAMSVKNGAGRIAKIVASGMGTGRYLKLYNKSSAPTVGTDVPVATFYIRAASAFDLDVSALGLSFSQGIAYAITAGPLDNDTGACVANDVVGLNIVYI